MHNSIWVLDSRTIYDYLIEWKEPEILEWKCMVKYMKRSEICLSINVWIWLVTWSRGIFIFGERFHRAITYKRSGFV